MKVLLDKDNYIIGIAYEGDLEDSIEVDDVELDNDNINSYRYNEGQFILDKTKILKEQEKLEQQRKVTEAQQFLKDTDYIVTKLTEYSITGEKSDKDYTEVLQKREEAREIIRQVK